MLKTQLKTDILTKATIFFLLIILLIGLLFSVVLLDQPVKFNDPNLELAIREELNHFYKPIYRSQLMGFVELDLSNRGIKDISGIESFRNLEVINLRANNIVDVSPLETLRKLHSLDLGYNQLIDLKIASFERITHLPITHLNLDHNTIAYEDKPDTRLANIDALMHFTNLESLSLIDNHITDLSPLKYLHELKNIQLIENRIKNLKGLESLSSLEKLNLRQNELEDISAISDLTRLQYLNLHSNPKIRDLSPIQDLINLDTLILRNVPIGDQINVLRNLTQLQRLNIRNCGVSNISVLIELMAAGALQDDPEKNIKAYLDILENKIPNDPHKLSHFNPYWDNIHTTYPLTINGSILEPPVFSFNSGFYNNSFFLKLHSPNREAKIFYTLDGSIPTNESLFYKDPIWIEGKDFLNTQTTKATVVRAKIIEENGFDSSPTISKSYFVGPTSNRSFTLPVVSLVTDPANLYDPDIGIATKDNYRRRGKKWERPLSFEFFETSGKKTHEQEILFRLHGQASRNLSQKSLRLYGENDYDSFASIRYDFFPDLQANGTGEPIDHFKTLILRNSGNDWNMTLFRDALIQRLVEYTSMDTQAYRPVNVFLNGNYWGILNIRERMDAYYIENHYGIDPENVLMYEVSTYDDFYNQNPDSNEFLRLLEFIRNQDDDDDLIYNTLEEKIDIQNFIDNQIIYIYSSNDDWLGNNVKFWKKNVVDVDPEAPYGHDGRWRWMVIDMDAGFIDYEKNMLPLTTLDREYTLIMSTLMKNDQYRIEFINRFADLLNTAFMPSRVIKEIDRMEATLEEDIEKHIHRWTSMNNSIDQWHDNVNIMRDFALNRPDFLYEQIINEFSLSTTIELNINTNIDQGFVRINAIDITTTTPGIEDPSSWTGIYFKDIPIELTAFPKPGYRFSHWEGINWDDAENETIIITPTHDLRIFAVFGKSGSN